MSRSKRNAKDDAGPTAGNGGKGEMADKQKPKGKDEQGPNKVDGAKAVAPMAAAFKEFMDSCQSGSRAERMKAWKESQERAAVLAGMTPAEIKRRRYE